MKEGDIGLAALQQENGQIKLRLALLLKLLPGFGDFVVCGISAQLRHEQKGLDEILLPDGDNCLKQISLVRLTIIYTLSLANIQGKIGEIPRSLHAELLKRLPNFFMPNNLA
jgi:mRNA interferase MazF